MAVTDRAREMQQYGPLRFVGEMPTAEQRENVIASGLYDLGDAVLVWVNEGDLGELALLDTSRAVDEPTEAMIEAGVKATETLMRFNLNKRVSLEQQLVAIWKAMRAAQGERG